MQRSLKVVAVLGTISVFVSTACSRFSGSDLPSREDGGKVEDGAKVSRSPVGPIVQLQSDVVDFGMVDCGHIAGP